MRLSRLGGRALRLGRLKGRKKILYFFYFGKKFCTILMGGGQNLPKISMCSPLKNMHHNDHITHMKYYNI